ncbi:MAG: carbohydrate ABC transporter permease [Candidatus Dormibacteraeota bacterium]|nr:carbohydrate ABC transporter permease [Candidatus Dormibacteraeota bacterium]
MTARSPSRSRSATEARRRPHPNRALGAQWLRFLATLLVTAIAVAPIAVVVYHSLTPAFPLGARGLTLENFPILFHTRFVLWLRNSALVTLVVVVAVVALAAPAGYVLSRGRGALVSGFSLTLFVLQSLPVVVALIPLFFLFARIGLVDNLAGVTAIYVGLTTSAATWMMGSYYDSIPIELEEAAWVDGAGVFGGFVRVVLRNSLPGLLSTATFTFLTAWNDYLVVLVFIRSQGNYTLPLGLQLYGPSGGLGSAYAVVMMLPPVIIFVALNRYFSFGGIGGSLAGR